MTMEREVLRRLGYALYSVADNHPHKFILYYVRILEGNRELAQKAWNYCNDSLRLPLSLRYEAEVIACACIYMACVDKNVKIPTVAAAVAASNSSSKKKQARGNEKENKEKKQMFWWELFIGKDMEGQISDVCNAIQGAVMNADAAAVYKDNWVEEEQQPQRPFFELAF
jgi:hypothetical protein